MTTLIDIQFNARLLIDSALANNLLLQKLVMEHNPGQPLFPEYKVVRIDIGPRTGRTSYAMDRLHADPLAILAMPNDRQRQVLINQLAPERRAQIVDINLLHQRYFPPGSPQVPLVIVDNASTAWPSTIKSEQFVRALSPQVTQFLFLG